MYRVSLASLCYTVKPFRKTSSREFHDAIASCTGFSLGLNDRAKRPVVLFSALSFFLSALSFFQRPVIFREPFGFFGLSSALFWAWSCRKRPIKAKGGAIFVHHVVIRVGHRRHLGFTMNINSCKLVRPVVFQDQLEHWCNLAPLHETLSAVARVGCCSTFRETVSGNFLKMFHKKDRVTRCNCRGKENEKFSTV